MFAFQYKISLLLVKGSVSEAAATACDDLGVVVINSVPYKVLEQISETTQTDMLTYVSLTTQV